MSVKDTKTIMFALLIVAMILPFSGMGVVEAEQDKNPRDKTLERIQEKDERKRVLEKIKMLAMEEKDLKEQAKYENFDSEKEKINKRLEDIKSEMNKIEKNNHKLNIPQIQLAMLIAQQTIFEERLLDSEIVRFVTSVGIDITSKEIQIGLNRDIVNSENIDYIVAILEEIMPANAKWHTVYSNTAESLACNQDECTPIIGGNYISVVGSGACSFGFQATKGSTLGWITAGHCADGLVGNDVLDHSHDIIGTVSSEKYYWGTSCDCAWITTSPGLTDNKIFGHGATHTITKTTQASEQQNDIIMKSGHVGGLSFGTVSAINVSVLDIHSGEFRKHLVRSNAWAEHGDSGGTVVESNDRGDLYGIVITHDWWGHYHAPIDQITAHVGVSPVLN